MKPEENDVKLQTSLPFDIALKIASSLEVLDICALSGCSQFWRELCGSDCIWESLTRERWPSISSVNDSSPSSVTAFKGWREIYIRTHKVMADKATSLVEFVEHCSSSDSLEFKDYSKAIEELCSMQLSFRDIQMFLFKPKLNVLINLIGLHYCIFCLKVPMAIGQSFSDDSLLLRMVLIRCLDIINGQEEQVMNALLSCTISERQLCVKWWKLGRWFFGFRMRDESHSRTVSLADLLTDKGEEVLGVLRRGAIHEVLRVEIAMLNATSIPWCSQSSQRQD